MIMWLLVLTPRFFYQELFLLNPDLQGIRVKPAPNVLPPGVNAGEVYYLPMFTAGQLTALRAEATRVLEQEKRQRGLVEARANVSQPEFVAGTLCWMAAEFLGDIKYGDQIPGVATIPVKGAKAIHALGDGTCILGKPEYNFKEIISKSAEHNVAWTLTGPRTARWCISYLSIEGLGLEGHHERFRQLTKVEPSSWVVQEHFQLSMILKHALRIDQINGYNTIFTEIICFESIYRIARERKPRIDLLRSLEH